MFFGAHNNEYISNIDVPFLSNFVTRMKVDGNGGT